MTTAEWFAGCEEHFQKICHQQLHDQFAVDGVVPTEVKERFDLEMTHVLNYGYFYSFVAARRILDLAKECGLHAIIGGNVAYSLLSYYNVFMVEIPISQMGSSPSCCLSC